MTIPTRVLVALGLAYITYSFFAISTNTIAAAANGAVMFGCTYALTGRHSDE